jgi:hypothetical protein
MGTGGSFPGGKARPGRDAVFLVFVVWFEYLTYNIGIEYRVFVVGTLNTEVYSIAGEHRAY